MRPFRDHSVQLHAAPYRRRRRAARRVGDRRRGQTLCAPSGRARQGDREFRRGLLQSRDQGKSGAIRELPATHQLIYSLDKNVPATLLYRTRVYLEKNEFDKAEEMIRQYERLNSNAERLLESKLVFHAKKGQEDKVREISQQGYGLYPANWIFAFTEAMFSAQTTKKYDRAISLIGKYLAKRYDETALHTLAGLYLRAPDMKKWNETYHKLFALDPASTNYYYEMAQAYFSRKDYAAAEKMLRKALELCPSNSIYWSMLAEIHRVKRETSLAQQCYREALKYQPFDYEARRALRELTGKPPIFSLFETADIKRLIAQAPEAKAYPESKGIILLQDTKRAVYEAGASESSEELLVKVFNKGGIDDFKEYWIAFNSHTQELLVEKAVVIKPNGTEIAADLDENHVVFKSLEENDTIYLKWNTKNYHSGNLFNDFWDTKYFNNFYPARLIRYSLLAPPGCQFRASAQNMPSEPVKKQTDAGVIHQWSAQDEPAIEYEVNMPVLADVGKVLYISSIDNWESIVSWYADLAQTKTRSSYEIREQVEKLFSGKKEIAEEEKIEIIYNFITENIRYSSVPFRQSGLIPQKARDVLVNKIGDCKDVATLFIAMLREVGLNGHYVLLNTRDAGQHPNALPAILFNHCLVAVETRQGLRYLDLTAHNLPFNSLPELDREAFSLLIKPGVNAPRLLPTERLAPSLISRHSRIEVKDDLGIQVQYKLSAQGTSAADLREMFRYKGPKEREKQMTTILGARIPDVRLTQLEFDGFDAPGPSLSIAYQYAAPNYVTETGQFKLLKLPWNDLLTNHPAPAQEKRKFPYHYWPSADRIEERIEIRLPAGYEPVDLGKELKISSPIADYSLNFTCADGVIYGRREMINKKAVVSPIEHAEFKQFYNRVVKEDGRSLLLRVRQ